MRKDLTDREPRSIMRGGLWPEFGEAIDRFYDEFWNRKPLTSLVSWPNDGDGFVPRLDITENEKEIKVKAELPGLEEKQVDVAIANDRLILKGKKEEAKEEKGENFERRERYFGAFHRVIPLSCEVNMPKATATFKNGLLTVVMPKAEGARKSSHRVAIKSAT